MLVWLVEKLQTQGLLSWLWCLFQIFLPRDEFCFPSKPKEENHRLLHGLTGAHGLGTRAKKRCRVVFSCSFSNSVNWSADWAHSTLHPAEEFFGVLASWYRQAISIWPHRGEAQELQASLKLSGANMIRSGSWSHYCLKDLAGIFKCHDLCSSP